MVLIEHGYAPIRPEEEIVANAGGRLVDAERLPPDQVLAECETADGILVRRLAFTREVIGRLRNCKIVLRYGVGTDNIDLEAATERGILVGHVPDYCLDEVSVHAISMLLACARRLVSAQDRMRAGGWNLHRADPVWRMAGKTLGLVGFGNIGQAVARKLQGWGLNLLACDPHIEASVAAEFGARLVDLRTLCRESDFVSLHVPLLPETRHLINGTTLAWMKPGAILVNTARGPLVEETALIEALDRGHLGQAALDVFETEPPAANSPLRSHPNIMVTDHMGWYSEESQLELQTKAAREVVRACTGGLPEAIANPEVLRALGREAEWRPNSTARWQLRRRNALQGMIRTENEHE